MEVYQLDEENRVILKNDILYLQRKGFKKDFPRKDFLYFLAAWGILLSILNFILGFGWESVATCFFATMFFILPIVSYYQIIELEINFQDSLIKHRYSYFDWKFRERILLNELDYVTFRLLPGEVSTADDTIISTFELTGRKHHYSHVDLFYFLNKETALKLIPIFKDKLGIEVKDELQNFQYLK
jgi:hypothetical protein